MGRQFEIGRILHLKSEISNWTGILAVQFKQDSSDFKIAYQEFASAEQVASTVPVVSPFRCLAGRSPFHPDRQSRRGGSSSAANR